MRIRTLAVLSLVLCAGGAMPRAAFAGAPIDRFWLGFDGDDFADDVWVAFGKEGIFSVPVPDALSTAWFDLDAIPSRLQAGPYTVTLTQPQVAFNLAVVDNVTLSGPGSLTLDNSAFIFPDQGGPTSGPTTLTLDSTLVIAGGIIIGQPSASGDLSTLRLLPFANLSMGAFMNITRFGAADLRTGFTGTLFNSGRLDINSDFISNVSINGFFEQTSTIVNGNNTIQGGTLAMDIVTTGLYDTLSATGQINLGGTLLVNQFLPATRGFAFDPGDRVNNFIAAPFVTGRFDAVFLPALDNGRFRVEYPDEKAPVNQSVSLVVEELPPQPEIGDGSSGAVAVNGRPVQAITADLNGDGFPDLAGAVPAEILARGIGGPIGGGVVVVLNQGVDGNGAWLGFAPAVTYLAGLGPVGIASGDVDQDGDIDLAVVNPGNPDFPAGLRALLNNSDGTFEDFGTAHPFVAAGADPRGVALGDFIPDALDSLDAAVTSLDANGDGQVVIFEGLQAPPSALAWGGFNAFQNIPLSNTNPGTIQPGGLDNPKEIDDLVVGGQFGIPGGGISVLFNFDGGDPNGQLFRPPQQVGTGDGPANITIQDMDNDGDSDIVTSNSVGGSVSLVLNEGIANDLGLFNVQTLPAGDNAGPLAVLDIDGDTDNDIAVVTQNKIVPGERVIQVLRNDTPVGVIGGPLSFAPGQTFGAAAGPLVILPGDADQDGDADLLAFTDPPAQPTQQATAFLNVLCPTDLDGSGETSLPDLTRFLADFGRDVEPGAPGDFNVDGAINTLDLVEVIGVFGTTCN